MRLKGLWNSIALAAAKADGILATHAAGVADVGDDNQDDGSGGKRTAAAAAGAAGGGGGGAKVGLPSPSSKTPRRKGNGKAVTGRAGGAGAAAGAATAGKNEKGMHTYDT